MKAQKETVPVVFLTSMRPCGCLLWLCLLMGLVFSAKGQTYVFGPNISGTWMPSGNPYIVADDCTVLAGATLTIQPGVVVEIGSGLSITNNGLIQAVGTPSQHIEFQAPLSSQYWNTIWSNYGGGTNLFTYCDFQNANTALSLSVVGGNYTMVAEILNCTFSNCVGQAIYVGAQGYANYCQCNSFNTSGTINPLIENCVFNTTSNGCVLDISGRNYAGYIGYGYCNPTIMANIFQNLTGTAVLMEIGSYAGGGSPVFVNNTVVNCVVGVNATDPWNAAVQDNIFAGCTGAVTASGSLSRTVSYNDFYNNATNFTGYPSNYGTVFWVNRNSTPADLFYNILQNPRFVASNDFHLSTTSACVNAGAPGGAFANLCFPPSVATNYPDLGAYGGPDACNWLSTVPVLPAVAESLSVSNGNFWLSWGAIPRSSYQILYSLTGPGSPNGVDSNDWVNLTNGQVLATGYLNQVPVWPSPSTNSKAFFCIQSLGRTPGN